MKDPFTITVDKPCSADRSAFMPTSNGGFCPLCEKEVVDFTKMSDAEVRSWFTREKGKTCGTFRKDQLGNHPSSRSFFRLTRMTGFLGLLVLVGTLEVNARELQAPDVRPVIHSPVRMPLQALQLQTVKGVVKDEEGQPLTGANIFLKGSPAVGTVADLDGAFEFPRQLQPGDILVFSFVGYETREYEITVDTPAFIEIELELFAELTGEVEVVAGQATVSGVSRLWSRVKGIFN